MKHLPQSLWSHILPPPRVPPYGTWLFCRVTGCQNAEKTWQIMNAFINHLVSLCSLNTLDGSSSIQSEFVVSVTRQSTLYNSSHTNNWMRGSITFPWNHSGDRKKNYFWHNYILSILSILAFPPHHRSFLKPSCGKPTVSGALASHSPLNSILAEDWHLVEPIAALMTCGLVLGNANRETNPTILASTQNAVTSNLTISTKIIKNP